MTAKGKPGDTVAPCTEAPTLRVRKRTTAEFKPRKESTGYTSPGYVAHFLPDVEVNLAKLNKALADVYGEPALRIRNLNLEIDEEYWRQICSDPWSGNIYRYNY
jgi:hypothetical protein